jgi:hypothetical protein
MTNDVVNVESGPAPVGRVFTGVEAGELDPAMIVEGLRHPRRGPDRTGDTAGWATSGRGRERVW